MTDINSKEFKRKYVKSKIKLRQWENEFIAQNGRVPTKEDIKSSPASVREHYKLYYTLKTRILEAQILGEEDANAEVTQLNRSGLNNVLKEYTKAIDGVRVSSQDDIGSDESGKEKYDTGSDKNNEKKVWGAHLNRTETVNGVEKEKCTLLNETIADRLFKGSSFKKRNPRKSLSFSKKKSNKSIISDDLKSNYSPDVSSAMSPCSDFQNDGDQSLNGSLFSVESDCSPNIKALITSSASLSPLLNKPEQKKDEKTSSIVQPVSLIQVVASDPSVVLKTTRNLDAGWVRRCTQACDEVKEERKSSDSGFDSMELIQILEESRQVESSDDDLIAGSDNELDGDRLTSSFIKQKRKAESSPFPKPTDGEENPSDRPACKRIKVDVSVLKETKPNIEKEMKKNILEKKMQSGRLNENYIRINLKKKVFVRGKKNFNFARHKKKEWKNKKKDLDDGRESGGVVQCYRCGERSHFGRYCQKAAEDKLLEDNWNDNEELPTLEEAEKMAKEKADENHVKRKNVFMMANERPGEEDTPLKNVDPLYSLKEDGTLQETLPEVFEALKNFGHDSFRPGQEEAIMRILSGQSTLLIVSTGGGKTLCYQLPAYLYAIRKKYITLVVSPLVSLMEDQVSGASSFFKVGCLHTNQTQKQREAVIDDAKSGKLYALLMSPEAVVAGDFFALNSVFRQLPPIAFACIDEVHCMSQWSHNFRPSYLMISKVLKEKLGVRTILGLTATATVSSIASITREFSIDMKSGVIRNVPLPENLRLSVSREENKDEALIRLLQCPGFKDANAILVYCTRRDECERLAVYIRTRLQRVGEVQGARSLLWGAEAYHAGLAAGRRRQVQRAFMRGNLRIVVATVAFGMGINKQDIRGVVHYNMPRDLESYVQEVGRAGRDGEEAFCHLFLDGSGRDLFELRRHVYANAVDRHVLRRLLQRVFRKCNCESKGRRCEGHEVAFDCAETVQALDIPEENIYTLLSYLGLHEKKFIKVLAPVHIKCKIKSYKGLKEIISAAKRCLPLAYGCALRSPKENSEILEFDVIEVADKLGWDSGVVKSQIKGLEWMRKEVEGKWRRTGIGVEFLGLGFRVCSRGDMTPFELDEALDYLIRRVESQEERSLTQLDLTFSTFDHFAKESHERCLEDSDGIQSQELKKVMRRYFETEELRDDIAVRRVRAESFDEEAVAADVRALICTYRDNTFNGRAVARIFHGIQSPNYPASLWFRCKFWRKHIDKDFNKISRLATVEILRFKT